MSTLYAQTCIGFVLDAIEVRSRHGFECNIGGTKMWLFPRLGAMSLDTPERVRYFGLRSVRTCGICRLRKGRSVTRAASRHVSENIDYLYQQANGEARTRPLQKVRKRCREKLSRHGFDRKKRCRLMNHVKHCLVSIPECQPILFAGLVRYEAMHVYYIGYCSWLLTHLVRLVPTNKYRDVGDRVKSCHQFRDAITGSIHPRLPSLIRLTNFTAEKRVRAVFYWAHVLGLQADVIVPPCRWDAQCAVATLQLLLIATRGHRSYTSAELDTIFKNVGRQFFVHLESIAKYVDEQRVQAAEADDPGTKVEPWTRIARYV